MISTQKLLINLPVWWSESDKNWFNPNQFFLASRLFSTFCSSADTRDVSFNFIIALTSKFSMTCNCALVYHLAQAIRDTELKLFKPPEHMYSALEMVTHKIDYA